jgi:hypothetical protein
MSDALEEKQTGPQVVTLYTPVMIDGREVKTFTMREPTVGDQLVIQAMKVESSQRELQLIANLCDVSVEALQKLTMRDWQEMQRVYLGFLDLTPDTSDKVASLLQAILDGRGQKSSG